MKIETISSQVFTKNGKFQILEKISYKENNKYVYKRKIKCIECGEEQIVYSGHLERCICNNCKKQNNLLNYVGKTYGTYTILSFNSIEHQENYDKKLFNVRCNNCGSESIQQLSHILKTPKSCSNCKYEIRIKNNPPKIESVRNCIKSTYISGAKNRNLPYELSDKKFDELIYGNCFYCGQEPLKYKSDEKFNKTDTVFLRNEIDRIDSTKGYSNDNCVSCCFKCNSMKSDNNIEDFIEHIEKIHNYLVNKGSTTIPKGSTSQANGDGNGEHPTYKEDDDIV